MQEPLSADKRLNRIIEEVRAEMGCEITKCTPKDETVLCAFQPRKGNCGPSEGYVDDFMIELLELLEQSGLENTYSVCIICTMGAYQIEISY